MFDDFETIIETIGDLPPDPIVASKVLEIVKDPLASFKDLAKTISHDPAVSARILKMANSVYGAEKEVSTLERAFVFLGETVVKKLVLESSLRAINRSYGVPQRRLWEDSIGCAIASRIIAEKFQSADPEEAFQAGLLRHIGKSIMLNRHTKIYVKALKAAENGEAPLLDVEKAFFAYSHEQIGAAVLDKWNYPTTLVECTLHHHDLNIPQKEENPIYPMVATINLAGCICQALGVGRTAPGKGIDFSQNLGAIALSATPEKIKEVMGEFEVSFRDERSFFLNV